MGFSRQEYWSGLPRPPLGDLPDPGIKPVSLMYPELTGGFFTTSTPWETLVWRGLCLKIEPFNSPYTSSLQFPEVTVAHGQGQ